MRCIDSGGDTAPPRNRRVSVGVTLLRPKSSIARPTSSLSALSTATTRPRSHHGRWLCNPAAIGTQALFLRDGCRFLQLWLGCIRHTDPTTRSANNCRQQAGLASTGECFGASQHRHRSTLRGASTRQRL